MIVHMVKEPQLGILWQKSSRLPNHSGLLQVVFSLLFEIFPYLTRKVFLIIIIYFCCYFIFPCLPREGEMHMCENNCALTLEDEIKFWGLDDTLLQVAAVFIISWVACLSACVCLFVLCLRSNFSALENALLQVTATFVIHCVSSVYPFEVKFNNG